MTNPYLIQAWCLRPFITTIDVEAKTPEQAIILARKEQDKLLDAAEECTRHYPWDEFAVYDESGNELLHHVDLELSVCNAAPDLLEALRSLADAVDGLDAAIDGVTDEFDPEREEVQAACDNARKAIAKAEVTVDAPSACKQSEGKAMNSESCKSNRLTPTNKQRSRRCAHVLRHYGTDDTDPGSLIDFLADARHWCDKHGENYAELDRIAYQHYLVELVESRRRQP